MYSDVYGSQKKASSRGYSPSTCMSKLPMCCHPDRVASYCAIAGGRVLSVVSCSSPVVQGCRCTSLLQSAVIEEKRLSQSSATHRNCMSGFFRRHRCT